MSAVLKIDEETGEILPSCVIVKTEKAPAIVIDISDVNLFHQEPEKLVDKIRTQASFAVFDIASEKGRKACNAHYNQIIKCIAPALEASKAKAVEAKKVINQDLYFRKTFEAGVREIAEYHRKPLTEYEEELQRVKDELAAKEAARIAEEQRIAEEAEAEKQRLFEEEKAKLEAEKLAMEQEKQRLAAEREKIELEIKLRAEAEQQRIADEKRHVEQLARQAEEAEKERIRLAEQAELDRLLAIKNATEKAEREAKQREEAARIAEKNRLEAIRLDALEKERQAALAPDKEKLQKLIDQISGIDIPECGEEARKVTDDVVILLGKVCSFIETRAAKL